MAYAIVSDLHFHNWKQFNQNGERLLLTAGALYYVARKAKEDYEVDTLYIAGDFFHSRGSWTPTVLNTAIDWLKKISDIGIKIRMIPGNHDLETRDADRLASALTPFENIASVEVVNEPTLYSDDGVYMIPWMADKDELKTLLSSLQCDEYDLIIHAPMNDVIQGIPNNGLSAQDVSGFKRVFAGHYHNHKKISESPEVYSIGALSHQTWNDVGTKAGGLIVTDSEVIHLKTLSPEFVFYDFSLKPEQQKLICKGNYVRVRTDKVLSDSDIETMKNFVMVTCCAQAMVFEVRKQKNTIERDSLAFNDKGVVTSSELVHLWIEENIEKDNMHKDEVRRECNDALTMSGDYVEDI